MDECDGQMDNPQIKNIAISKLASDDRMVETTSVNITTLLPKPDTAPELLKNISFVLNTK
ncbi:hypothetical protein CEN44_25590 [Fischerella muscicola CCMEE 5323]|uniref:Uncharacterized protein n=1 Tax=Fischerella muscicola CCMEE 5323 TaxID=2019572 RepID=A0A2N6JW41_FISMU|nr:hypothetical protein CEN44_25590 [Fischerella muscicola CCMEE 5323]